MNEMTLELHGRKLAAIRNGLIRDNYLTIRQLMDLMGASRSVVEAIPIEILPFIDVTPLSSRVSRRYDPRDVEVALKALLPRYQAARARGEGHRFLEVLRGERARYEESLLVRAREAKEV